MDFETTKRHALTSFHDSLAEPVKRIADTATTHQKKAKAVNDLVAKILESLTADARKIDDDDDRQNAIVIAQYAACVASLEYRHAVWPYEYMAFSRRIGELWERFCATSWDEPSREGVRRIREPKFKQVKQALYLRLPDDDDARAVFSDVWELVGEINMKEDEVFEVDGVPHVVDFKSGFGSNEKGNTLRLLSVGKAYRVWNSETKLLLLVRQMENNNYLEVLRRSKLWEVHCGEAAYAKIDELTGSNMVEMRGEIINFEEDLSEKFLADIDEHLSNMRSYLEW